MSAEEQWLPVRGYEDIYEVSNLGRVRSLPRMVLSRWNRYRRIPGVVLRGHMDRNGYHCVRLWRKQASKTMSVHRLVALAFLADSYFAGAQVCHNDGDQTNNHVSNLRWDTASANHLDRVRHGTHPEASRTHCVRGHEYSPENTRIETKLATGRPKRHCRICDAANQRRRRQLAKIQAVSV